MDMEFVLGRVKSRTKATEDIVSTSVSQLAHETFKKMVAEGFTPIKCEVIGHKPSAQDLSQLREESHEAARDLLETYEIEDSMIATSVELVDTLTASAPKATPTEPETDPDLVTPGFVPVSVMPQRQAEMQKLIMLDTTKGFYSGQLASSGRHLWSRSSSHALVVTDDQFTYYSRLLRETENSTLLALWDGSY